MRGAADVYYYNDNYTNGYGCRVTVWWSNGRSVARRPRPMSARGKLVCRHCLADTVFPPANDANKSRKQHKRICVHFMHGGIVICGGFVVVVIRARVGQVTCYVLRWMIEGEFGKKKK